MLQRYDPTLILGYVEGDLSPQDRSRLELILTAEPRLRALVETMAEDRTRLRQLPFENPPPDLAEQAIQSSEREMLLGPTEHQPRPPRAQNLRFRWILTYSSIAALLIFCVTVAIVPLTEQSLIDNLPSGRATSFTTTDNQRSSNESRPYKLKQQPISKTEAPALAKTPEPTVPLENEQLAITPVEKPPEVNFLDRQEGKTVPDASEISVVQTGDEPTAPTTQPFREPVVLDKNIRRADAMAAMDLAALNDTDEAPIEQFVVSLGPVDKGESSMLGQKLDTTLSVQTVELDGSTALDEISPTLQPRIQIITDNPDATRRVLLAWADKHDAIISVEEATRRDPTRIGSREDGLRLGSTQVTPTTDQENSRIVQRMVVQCRQDQLKILQEHLNQIRGVLQRARLITGPGDKEVAASVDARMGHISNSTDLRSTEFPSVDFGKSAIRFNWDRILESELPLVTTTPIKLASKQPQSIALPVVIVRTTPPTDTPISEPVLEQPSE